MKLIVASGVLAALPSVLAWGAAGHEIVATIAQIHLHPNVQKKLCDILPAEAKCHLAPVAAWADQVKRNYPGSAAMHYVNPKMDHPGDHCEFGEHGWVNEDVNVLTAIMNQTSRLMNGEGDIPLRFLVHFIGDMHQPLHLTGRDRGGNNAMFRFEGRQRNLHSVWDSGIITKNIRELGNYTTPLPSKQIESALLGAIFDPYVRFIVWEGLRQWWRDDLPNWLTCPADGDPYPHSSIDASIPPSLPAFASNFRTVSSFIMGLLPSSLSAALTVTYPIPLKETENASAGLLAAHPLARRLGPREGESAEENTAPFIPACPFTWSKPIHQLNCDVIWPQNYTGDHNVPLIELDTPGYLGRINEEKITEKLLAMGGLRLASVLNTILGDQNEQGLYFSY